ncbi:MBL fold metallo-hydrolase [Longimicrobium sp.]|jgi:phosphoribosyl 1,2-cyclic phosphodiesterase|uniref:MBL fold metallo-hydrolase n=1 Tax=Longimicrobium sp. TaxID=2029185 RepID=UPI002F94E4BA
MIPPPGLTATCWGTRGSIPAPGPDTVRYGGNTPCLEVQAQGRRYIFDAGTGIRALSRALQPEEPVEAELFLTHFHWDHVQGFPFCGQLYHADSRIRVHGPPQDGVGVASVLAGIMAPAYFPVPLDALAAGVEFVDVDTAPWTDGAVEVDALRVCHPGFTCGYRLRTGGASLAYVPDNELREADAAQYRQMVEWAAGVDLLVHDAMWRDDEYARYRGWGHGSVGDAVRLAEDAGARRLLLFHYAPERRDDELDDIVSEVRRGLAERGSALRVDPACEGVAISLCRGDA